MKKIILCIICISIWWFVGCTQHDNNYILDVSEMAPTEKPTITLGANGGGMPSVTPIGSEEIQQIPEYFMPLLGEKEGVAGYIKKDKGLVKTANATVDEASDFSYYSVEESLGNGYIFRVKWIKISKELIIEDIAIDLSSYYKNRYGWFQDGLFYNEECGSVFIKFDATDPELLNVTGPVLLMVEVPTDNPEDYKIIEFDDFELKKIGLWFSDASCVGSKIYDNQGNDTVMWTIDMQTKELQSLEYVQNKTEEITNQILEEMELGEQHSIWYSVAYQQNDVTVYNAIVCREMDTEWLFILHLAFDGQEYLGTMLEDWKTGELKMWNGSIAK